MLFSRRCAVRQANSEDLHYYYVVLMGKQKYANLVGALLPYSTDVKIAYPALNHLCPSQHVSYCDLSSKQSFLVL